MRIRVELVYALPEHQQVVALEVEEGATVAEVIAAAGLSGIHHEPPYVGIFGKRVRLDAPVGEGDRIEIYRPLSADPKEARRAKARRRSS